MGSSGVESSSSDDVSGAAKNTVGDLGRAVERSLGGGAGASGWEEVETGLRLTGAGGAGGMAGVNGVGEDWLDRVEGASPTLGLGGSEAGGAGLNVGIVAPAEDAAQFSPNPDSALDC